MAIPVTVPRRGWSMEEGTFVEWLRCDGDQIEAGDSLFVLESEKATENIEAIDAGILRISLESPKPGEIVKVGQVLAYLVMEGETLPAMTNSRKTGPGVPAEAPISTAARPGTIAVSAVATKCASPRARRVAKELGIEWANLAGSGRNGRVRECDVRAAANPALQAPPPA